MANGSRTSTSTSNSAQRGLGWLRPLQQWLAGWWQVLHLGAVLGVLALSASGRQQARSGGLAAPLVGASGPLLVGFSLVSALISLVVIRIVIVTAQSYGLSQYALEMVVRVLVLELIPLAAALFGAVNATLPMADEVAVLRSAGAFEALRSQGRDPLATLVLPRLLAGLFAVLLLAVLSCVVSLVLAYLLAHGFSLGGFARYSRTVGRVFSPSVTLIFGLKVFLLGSAVAWLPLVTVLQTPPGARARTSAELRGLVRLFLVLLLVEAASLVGNYH
jgi:phospholipid/cholesterol/gamma-HCH transport system permease protein